MPSKTRNNTLARIRARNKKLPKGEQISIKRGTSTAQLKSLEKTLNTKIRLNRAGLNTGNINRSLTPKQRSNYNKLAMAQMTNDRPRLASALNSITRSNRKTLNARANQLGQLEGSGS